MMKEIAIAIADIPRTVTYKVTSALRLNLNGSLIETLEEVDVDIQYIRLSEGKQVFNLIVKERKFESSKADFFDWGQKVNRLLDEMTIITNHYGEIVQVQILEPLKKWYAMDRQLRKEYKGRPGLDEMMKAVESFFFDKKKIIGQLNNNGFQQMLFAGHYGKYPLGVRMAKEKIFPALIGGLDLPVTIYKTVTQLQPSQKKCTVSLLGELDEAAFDRKNYIRWIKDISNEYDLKANYLFEQEETYHFDDGHWLETAESYLSFTEPGIYELTMAKTVKTTSAPVVEKNNWYLETHNL